MFDEWIRYVLGVFANFDTLKMAKNSHFDHFEPFLVKMVDFENPIGPEKAKIRIFQFFKKCRGKWPESIPHQFGTILKGFSGQKWKNLILGK